MVTDTNILTLIRPDPYWNWRDNNEYWRDEPHKESLFDAPVAHLIDVFFFHPSATGSRIKSGKYNLYIRHSADSNCNLLDQAVI